MGRLTTRVALVKKVRSHKDRHAWAIPGWLIPHLDRAGGVRNSSETVVLQRGNTCFGGSIGDLKRSVQQLLQYQYFPVEECARGVFSEPSEMAGMSLARADACCHVYQDEKICQDRKSRSYMGMMNDVPNLKGEKRGRF